MRNLPSGWNVFASYGKSYDVGIIIQGQTNKKDGETKGIAVPTKALRDIYKDKRFVLAISDDGLHVALFECSDPDAVRLASTGMHALTTALKAGGYSLEPGTFYPIKKMDVERGFEIENKPEKRVISLRKERKKPSKPSAKEPQAERTSQPAAPSAPTKEYRLPEVEDNGPAEWAQACMLMAQAVPKTTISKEIGVSIADCRILEVQCAQFIARLKEFDKECKRDMAKGLAKAVIESWERQLRSKAS